MQVKLRVLAGASAGREIPVKLSKFTIGRGDDCQLRPKSDLISRRHCRLTVEGGKVTICDLQSRNGTLVNGELIEAERELNAGDRIKIGPLEFEVVIDHGLGGTKRPKVKDIEDVAERAGHTGEKLADGDVSRWLEEADDVDREERLADPETRQFKLSDAERAKLEEAARQDAADASEDDADAKKQKKPKKKEPGKLPPLPEKTAKDSTEAAAQALRKFFTQG